MSDPTAAGNQAEHLDELVYASWGGTGRAVTLRLALIQAAEAGAGLVYLAILDDRSFGDLDETLRDLVADELRWLLEAQLELTKSQTGLDEVAIRLLVRAGDVVDEISEVAETVGPTRVLIGGPVPGSGGEDAGELLSRIEADVSAPVEILQPA